MVFRALVERLESLAEKRPGLEYKQSGASAWETWRKAAALERRRQRRHAAPHRMAARSNTLARRRPAPDSAAHGDDRTGCSTRGCG